MPSKVGEALVSRPVHRRRVDRFAPWYPVRTERGQSALDPRTYAPQHPMSATGRNAHSILAGRSSVPVGERKGGDGFTVNAGNSGSFVRGLPRTSNPAPQVIVAR